MEILDSIKSTFTDSHIKESEQKTVQTEIKKVQQEEKKEILEPKEIQLQKADLSKMMDILNKSPFSDTLKFGFNNDIEMLYVQIRDRKSDNLIRQYPTEQFIRNIMYSNEQLGMLFDVSV